MPSHRWRQYRRRRGSGTLIGCFGRAGVCSKLLGSNVPQRETLPWPDPPSKTAFKRGQPQLGGHFAPAAPFKATQFLWLGILFGKNPLPISSAISLFSAPLLLTMVSLELQSPIFAYRTRGDTLFGPPFPLPPLISGVYEANRSSTVKEMNCMVVAQAVRESVTSAGRWLLPIYLFLSRLDLC